MRRRLTSLQGIKDVAGKPIAFGTARYFGGVTEAQLGSGVVGIAAGPGGHGYWLAKGNGTVFGYGNAASYGSGRAPAHVVAIVATRDGAGYWLACSTGGVFNYGDASSYGSASNFPLSTPIAAMAARPDGRGYWLVAAGGRVFAYGDARIYGSATPELSNDQVVAMAATADGRGYWLVASDGRVFAYGDAHPYGSPSGLVNARVVAMAATADGRGYWLAASDGEVFAFGDAHLYGSASSVVRENPIVAMAASPDEQGYWLLPTSAPPTALPAPGAGFVAGHVTAIGDSVMLDAEPDLVADIPGIDVEAAVSRQWYEGVDLAQQLKSEGRLGAIVVIDLGTNGPVTPEMFTQMMDVLAGASRVVFVTVHLPSYYTWSKSVNATLAEVRAPLPARPPGGFQQAGRREPAVVLRRRRPHADRRHRGPGHGKHHQVRDLKPSRPPTESRRRAARQPSITAPRKARATATNAGAVPWPETTRRIMPRTTVEMVTTRPQLIDVPSRRDETTKAHAAASPETNGHVVEATPAMLSPWPCALRPITTNTTTATRSISRQRALGLRSPARGPRAGVGALDRLLASGVWMQDDTARLGVVDLVGDGTATCCGRWRTTRIKAPVTTCDGVTMG